MKTLLISLCFIISVAFAQDNATVTLTCDKTSPNMYSERSPINAKILFNSDNSVSYSDNRGVHIDVGPEGVTIEGGDIVISKSGRDLYMSVRINRSNGDVSITAKDGYTGDGAFYFGHCIKTTQKLFI